MYHTPTKDHLNPHDLEYVPAWHVKIIKTPAMMEKAPKKPIIPSMVPERVERTMTWVAWDSS
eukprot:2677438-Karenia_brevis.AAC.1